MLWYFTASPSNFLLPQSQPSTHFHLPYKNNSTLDTFFTWADWTNSANWTPSPLPCLQNKNPTTDNQTIIIWYSFDLLKHSCTPGSPLPFPPPPYKVHYGHSLFSESLSWYSRDRLKHSCTPGSSPSPPPLHTKSTMDTHYSAESLSWYSRDRLKHSCTPWSSPLPLPTCPPPPYNTKSTMDTHYSAESLSWYSRDRLKHSCTPGSFHCRFMMAASSGDSSPSSELPVNWNNFIASSCKTEWQ